MDSKQLKNFKAQFLKISKLLGKNLNNNIYETRIPIFLDFYLMPTYHRKIVSPFLEINDFTVYFCIIVRLYQISHVISIFFKIFCVIHVT